MNPAPFRAGRLVATAVTAALTVLLAGCPSSSEDPPPEASSGELSGAATRFGNLPLRPPTVIGGTPSTGEPPTPGTGGTSETDVVIDEEDGMPTPSMTAGNGNGNGTAPPAEAGGTVLDRVQTRFRSEDDADFWICFVFLPRATGLAYNFVGNIGAAVAVAVGEEDEEPVVNTYAASVTGPDALLLDYLELGQAEALENIVVTGTGSTATLRMNSSTWGALDCSVLNSGDA